MNETRLNAVVRGVVQGVGFRMFVLREGRRLGVAGWVRNRPAGSVEVAAEGREEALRQLLTALARGPAGSRVSEVESDWSEAVGECIGFSIRE